MKNTESRKSARGYFDKNQWGAKTESVKKHNPWLAEAMATLGDNIESLTSEFENPEVVSNFIYPH